MSFSKMFIFFGLLFGCLNLLLKDSFLMILNMFQVINLDLDFCVLMDWMTLMFSSVLFLIVGCVLKFSEVYMHEDIFKIRFTMLVLSFVFSMVCLMFIPHFFFLLVGWDGLGITSFLLVIYYLSSSSWAAGMKTFLINRIGDSFFIVGLVLFLSKGYWDVTSSDQKDLLALIVVMGCFTKSAQFPFSSWLPAAMAAPTPVSALVHSSTLVTAGVYVMIRFSKIFPYWLFCMMGILGVWTLYSASLAACVEYDGKKMVAYSTLSQLGLMCVAISLNISMVAFFHLVTHAMFKALIFMCMGYLIKNSGHFQDLRSLKGLWVSSPVMGYSLIMSSLSLMGFPFLAGFFSKELILEKNILIMNSVFHLLLLFSLPFTSYYSCRLVFSVLKGGKKIPYSGLNDSKVHIWSMIPLYMGSMILGSSVSSFVYSLSSMYPCYAMKFFVLLIMFSGVLLSWYDMSMKNNSLMFFFSKMCFLVPFKSSFWVSNSMKWGTDFFCKLDQGLFSTWNMKVDLSKTRMGEKIHNLFTFFLSPQAIYYVSSMMGVVSFMGFCFILL